MTNPPVRIALVGPVKRDAWECLTQEQRSSMTVAELVKAMSHRHVHHALYQPRQGASVHVQNVAGRCPVIMCYEAGAFADFRKLWRWMTGGM